MRKRLAFFLLLFSLGVHGQTLVTATPAPFAGTSGVISLTVAGGAVSLNTYYFTWVAPALAQYLQPNLVPANDCVVKVIYNAPGYAYATLAPDFGGNAFADVGSYTGLESQSVGSYGQYVSNSQCTVHGMLDGSSVQAIGSDLKINLKMDFNFANFSGAKRLYFGYRTNTSGGPSWVGPLFQNGVVSEWNIGTRARAFTNGNDAFGALPDNVAPAILFVNLAPGRTDQNTVWLTGDPYHLQLIGPPNGSYSAARTQNGAPSTLSGTLPANGILDYFGTIAQNEVGNWTTTWTIAGFATPQLVFNVAQGPTSLAIMQSPGNGATLPGSSVTFNWSAGSGASAYWLDVGTVFGQGNIYAAQLSPGVLSQTVANIPVTGQPIYVRLWTLLGGWQVNDYTYTAAFSGTYSKAQMLSPANGSTIPSALTFNWSSGSGASAYWLDVGTVFGQGNIFAGNLGLAQSQAVAGIPAGTIYVRLWTLLNGAWQVNDYTYYR